MSIIDTISGIIAEVKEAVVSTAAYQKGYITAKSKIGGSCYRTIISHLNTPDAGENTETKLVTDIGAILRGIDTTEDNFHLVVDSALMFFNCYSTKPFIMTPFLALQENGESITRQSGSEPDPQIDIDLAITGQYGLKLGNFKKSQQIMSNGTVFFITNSGLDITSESKKYMNGVVRDIGLERSSKELNLGIHTLGVDNNIAIQCYVYLFINYHLAPAASNKF